VSSAESVRPLAYQVERATQLPETWVLVLNRYQRDNLLWLLNAVGYPWDAGPVEPFTLANTGDWVGELALMLMKTEGFTKSMTIDANDRPNMSKEELAERVSRWVQAQHSDGADGRE